MRGVTVKIKEGKETGGNSSSRKLFIYKENDTNQQKAPKEPVHCVAQSLLCTTAARPSGTSRTLYHPAWVAGRIRCGGGWEQGDTTQTLHNTTQL